MRKTVILALHAAFLDRLNEHIHVLGRTKMSRFRHVMQYKGPESAKPPPLVLTLNMCDSLGKKSESSPPNLGRFMAG